MDFLNAAEDLLALRKKQSTRKRRNVEDEKLDLDLLLGTSKSRHKGKLMKEDDTSKAEQSTSQQDLRNDIEVLEEVEQDDDLLESEEFKQECEFLERTRREQRNRNNTFRLKALDNSLENKAEEIMNYIKENSTPEKQYVSHEKEEIDDTDVPIMMMIRWKYSQDVDTFMLKKYETLEKIFKQYAEKANVSIDRIVLEMPKGEVDCFHIKPWYTADRVAANGSGVIDGFFIDKAVEKKSLKPVIRNEDSDDSDDDIDDGKKEYKMQVKGRRERIVVRVGDQEALKLAMKRVASEVAQPLEKLRFFFDGDLVSPGDTPAGLDLDGGELFDVQILE